MIRVKIRSIDYYQAVGWCMSNLKSKSWSSDPINNEISFKNSEEALLFKITWA